jgi:tripartite-type tricarboxylate transporter receptor subunit TctC
MRWLILAVAATLVAIAGASAQVYPARAITMIVPFPAGGATDTIARIMNERLKAALGQPIIIENVGGAGCSIGVSIASSRAGALSGSASATSTLNSMRARSCVSSPVAGARAVRSQALGGSSPS